MKKYEDHCDLGRKIGSLIALIKCRSIQQQANVIIISYFYLSSIAVKDMLLEDL